MTARRDFLAFAARTVAAGTVLPTAARAELRPTSETQSLQLPSGGTLKPDVELFALCALFHQQHADCLTVEDDHDGELLSEAMDVRWRTSDQIEDIATQTPEGLRAKAEVAVVLLNECHGAEGPVSSADRFGLATLRDLAGAVVA